MTSPDKSSHWTPSRIVKWFFLCLLAFLFASVVLLTSGLFIFNYWLKTADIKPAVEWITAKITGGEADFGSVKADLTRGVSAKKIRLKLPAGAGIDVEKLDIGFDLRALIKGSLKIDHINVDRPHIIFADTANKAGRPAGATKVFAIPTAPIFISLGSLSVKDISFEYAGAGVNTRLSGLNLAGRGVLINPDGFDGAVTLKSSQNSSCSFSFGDVSIKSVCDVDLSLSSGEPGKGKLKGSAGLTIVSANAPYKIEPGKVTAELDTDFSAGEGLLSGHSSLKTSLYGKPALNLTTDWKISKRYLQYKGRITRLSFDLKHMPRPLDSADYLLSGFASFSPATIKGRVALEEGGRSALSISGAGTIRVGEFKSQKAKAPEGITITAQLNGLTFEKEGVAGKALVTATSPVIESSGVTADNLKVSIEANPAGFSSGKIYVSASVDKAIAKDFQINKTILNATVLGDFFKGDLGFIKTEISLLDKSRIAVFGAVQGFGRKGLDLTAEIQAPLKDMEPWLKGLTTPVKVHSGLAQATIKAKAMAGVDNAFPEIDLSVKMKIRDFVANLIGDPRSEIGPADFDLYFKGADFGIDHLKTKFLGGDLTGSMSVKNEGERHTLRMKEVFTGIKLGDLLKNSRSSGEKESAIDGDMSLDIDLPQAKTGDEIDIAGIRFSGSLSRISAKTLDRLLRFLDPNGSFPSVTSARMALKNAKPSKVNILVSHGALSVTIDFKNNPPRKGQAKPMTVIERFAIQSLANFDTIRPYLLSKLTAISKAMRLLAATRAKINENRFVSSK